LWRQMQADVLGKPITTINSSEGPALGVAILAGVGTGVYASVAEAADAVIQRDSTCEVNAKDAETYNRYYQVYKELYPALKRQYAALADILG